MNIPSVADPRDSVRREKVKEIGEVFRKGEEIFLVNEGFLRERLPFEVGLFLGFLLH